MMAISLWQPHAWLIGRGKESLDSISQAIRDAKFSGDWPPHKGSFLGALAEALTLYETSLDKLPMGGIVAVGVLKAVYPADKLYPKLHGAAKYFGDFGPGRYAWAIEDVTLLSLIPCRGERGLWALDRAIVQKIEMALK